MKFKYKLFLSALIVLTVHIGINVAYAQAPVAKPQRPTKTEQVKPQKNKTQSSQPERKQPEQIETPQPTLQPQPPKREWKQVNLTDRWEVDTELKCYSNTATDLSVWNYHAETPENKKNNLQRYYGAIYPLPTQQSDDEYEINLSIANKNNNFASKSYEAYTSTNVKEYVNNGNCWQVVIVYKTTSGQEKIWRISYNDYYSVAPRPLGSDGNPIGAESRSNATSVCISDDNIPGTWTSTFWRDSRNITIKLADGKMTISGYVYDGQTSMINVESITLIGIGLTSTAYIDASLKMKRLSYYNDNGQAQTSSTNYSQSQRSDNSNTHYNMGGSVKEHPYPEVLLASPGLKVTKVTVGNGYTILDLQYENTVGSQFWINSDSYIYPYGDYNTKFKLIKADGVSTKSNTLTKIGSSGYHTFRLYFPELPEGKTKFDFTEGNNQNAWHIFGINLK